MNDNRIWVLGAPDPEMEQIERILHECGERVEYATVWRDGVRRRVTPAEAYAPDVEIGAGLRGLRATAYMVECAPAVLVGSSVDGIDWAGAAITIDHHRPGDPGYGRQPEEFFKASSIGQVIATLARLVPLGWETFAVPSWPWAPGTLTTVDRDRRVWRSGPGVYATGSGEWDWAVSFATCCWYIIPREFVLAAAADHCLAAAYRGECPGVDPDELMRWRAESRARFQGRTVEEVLADVERAQAALLAAPELVLLDDPCSVVVRDMRQPVDQRPIRELPEAATRLGIGYVSGPLVGPDGRKKITCSGTADQVRAFLDRWAPSQGLVDAYGDPARGFAGAYVEEVGR